MMQFYNNDKPHINLKDDKTRPIHWLLLIIGVFFYIGFNSVIIYMSSIQRYIAFAHISKYTLSGILAQGQVLIIILLTLNPMKRSHQTALILCGITSVAALATTLIRGSTDPLPGIFVPLISGTVSIIINNYSRRLKDQLNRVVEYSMIVKKNEQMLHSLAYYDSLTGLPNKKTLMDQADMLQERSNGFYLVYIDVDDLKKVADTLGQSLCDAVLQSVAQRWKQYCRHEDLLARVGFSEFIILISRDADTEDIRGYLKGFCDVLKDPVCIGRKEFLMHARFGVAKCPDHGVSAEELLRNADMALVKAKKLGKNVCQFFTHTLGDEVKRKNRLENDLAYATQNNELFLVYQPHYDCGSFRLRGFEALARWNHPELGVISPVEFIPIAEETGIMHEIGRWAIEAALSTFAELRDKADINTVISINLSVKQLLDPSFPACVSGILKKTGFDSRYLEFEMTESVLGSGCENVIGVLDQLKNMGIGLAIDDFGKGTASLNDLKAMPVSLLKIDKAMIDRTALSDRMTGAIISLAHALDLEVVAKGVEQVQQMEYLSAKKCDYVQGYFLSRPVLMDQIENVFYESAPRKAVD